MIKARSHVSNHLFPVVLKLSNLKAVKAEGNYVYCDNGRKYLDFGSGIGVTSTGHCHPRVVKAVQDQAAKLIHAQQNIFGTHNPQVELIQRLVDICPPELSKYFFVNSGSEAVDNAIKIARAHTGRPNVVAFEGGFHGRTMGAMSITSSKTSYRQGFQPLMPGCFMATYPYCLRCPVREAKGGLGYQVGSMSNPLDGSSERTCCNYPVRDLRMLFRQQTDPAETAAIIIEPILGEGGFLTPPPQFLATLREICDQHGIVLIFDEVQCGVARTGKWWAHEHWGVTPDILIFAKGIASGVPMAGLAARPEFTQRLLPGTFGGTYGGNCLASAAAVATIDVIQEENLLQNAAERGQQLSQGLTALSEKFPMIKDIRGRGLMIGMEFDDDHPGCASRLSKACLNHGLLLLTAGCHDSIRCIPGLTISEREIDEALGIIEKGLHEVFEGEVSAYRQPTDEEAREMGSTAPSVWPAGAFELPEEFNPDPERPATPSGTT